MRKVIKIINSLDFGGIERVFEIFARYYAGPKDNIVFISIGTGGKAADYIRSIGFRVITLNQPTQIPNVKIILMLYRILKKEGASVVHTCGAEGNFHGLIAAWLAGVPMKVGEEIGIPSHSKTAQRIFRFIYSKANAVIAVSAAVKDYLIEKREVVSTKIHLIYNPVDIGKFAKGSREPSKTKFVFLSVCRLTPIKNLPSLIECFASVKQKHPSSELWIVGDGPDKERLLDLTKSLNLEQQVIFHGYHPDPSPFLRKASAFVLPSYSEGHPVSVVEAMVAGVPVIVTRVGGGPEIIEHQKSGWLIDPHDKGQIIQTLINVIESSTASREMIAEKAKAEALARFSPQEYFDRLEMFYK